MPQLIVVSREGEKQAVETEYGRNVMEIVRDAGSDEMLAICGGCCSCATCHVYIQESFLGKLKPVSEDEDDLLDSSDYRQYNSRLACQVTFAEELEGVEVQIAPEG